MTEMASENIEKITELIKEIMQVALDEVGESEGSLPREKALSWYMIVARTATSLIDSATDMLLDISEKLAFIKSPPIL